MSQIDVTVVVDVETILRAHPASLDSNYPLPAFGGYVHLVVDHADALLGDGSQLLVLAAAVGDEIRWQAFSATLASQYTVALYRFTVILGELCMGQPRFNVSTVRCFCPSPPDALSFFPQDICVPYWSVDLNSAGLVIYGFAFAVLDSAGVARGYYSWGGTIGIREA